MNGALVVAFLVVVLGVWEGRKMVALSEAAADPGGPAPDAFDEGGRPDVGHADPDEARSRPDADRDDDLIAGLDDELGGLDPHIGVTRGDPASHERPVAERHTNVGGPRR